MLNLSVSELTFVQKIEHDKAEDESKMSLLDLWKYQTVIDGPPNFRLSSKDYLGD